MRTITQTLNMAPGGVPPVIHVSQYDSDFTITFTLFSLFGGFTIESGTAAQIRGTKSSGTGYSADAAINISAKTVTVTGDAQMTAAAGQNVFEIVLKKNNKEISSKNFILHVERAALDADTITDESVLRELDAIIEGAETATQAAEDAEDAADRAEAAAQLIGSAVTYTTQSKTVVEKAQARNNINAQEDLGVEYGENLFDSEDVTLDKVFYTSDAMTKLRDGQGNFASNPINVNGLSKIIVSNIAVIGQYDENGNAITPTLQPQNSILTPVTYSLGSNVHYIRVCAPNSKLNSVCVRTPGFTIPELHLSPNQKGIATRFYGLKASIIGDSIESFDDSNVRMYDEYNMYYPRGSVTSLDQMWWKRVIDTSGMLLEKNASFSGARASKTYQALSFYDRVSSIGTPDVIFVALGTNDSYYSVAVGEYDFTTAYASLSETTFRPAYIKGVKALQATYPNALIVCIAKKMGDEYKESIIQIAKTLGVVFIDASDYIGEGNELHPGELGMKQISSLVLYPTDESLTQRHIPADARKIGDHFVRYDETQDRNVLLKKTARDNIGAQESLGVEYSENLFDSEDVTLNKVFYSSDPITRELRDGEGFFASGLIDVSGCEKITVCGCEIIRIHDVNQATITPRINPQDTHITPYTYILDDAVKYISVCGAIANIDSVYIRKPEFTIPNLKLTSSQAAGNEYITPEMFGAAGDGETDDSNAFALAIADGRPIKLMAKTYKANLYINRSNVTIEGVFGVSRLMPADPTKPIIKINSDSAVYIEDLVTYVTLRDFTIYGNWQNVIGLHARACQYCWFERLWFHRCFAGGLVFEGVWDSKVRDCDVITCGNRGMETDDGFNNYAFIITKTVDPTTGSTKMKSNALVIDGCHFEHIPRCFDINNVFQVLITNCKYEAHCRAYGTNPEYSPIRVREQVKGLHFVNDIFTYNGVNVDDTSIEESFSNGIPFITVNTEANEANAERITVISNCQFATQPGLVAVYFSGNQTIIDGCNFDRCATLTPPIVLKDFCSLVNCDMLIYQTGTVVNVDGAYSIVDNLRIFDADEDATKPVIAVTNSAQCGYVKAIYNGTNRDNLAEAGTGGFKIPVEFIGLRSFPAT